MDKCLVLVGPTLDRVLGLMRLRRLVATPLRTGQLKPGTCMSGTHEILALIEALPEPLRALLTPTPAAPLHVMVTAAKESYRARLIKHHVCSSPLPEGSFMRVADGVLVPSWPLYFVLRCRELPKLSDRLKLGMELCGTYSHLIPGDESTSTFTHIANEYGPLESAWNNKRIMPATSAAELRAYLVVATSLRGRTLALEAVRYLLDNSASPCETILGLMASLPCSIGGYGFTHVELNPAKKVPEKLRHLTHFVECHPDCFLVDLQTDLEFASSEHHTGKAALRRDAARRNDIQTMGIEVKDVTWDMLSRFDSLELLFGQLLHKEQAMGVRGHAYHVRRVREHENVERRRRRLQELLPPWPYEP